MNLWSNIKLNVETSVFQKDALLLDCSLFEYVDYFWNIIRIIK